MSRLRRLARRARRAAARRAAARRRELPRASAIVARRAPERRAPSSSCVAAARSRPPLRGRRSSSSTRSTSARTTQLLGLALGLAFALLAAALLVHRASALVVTEELDGALPDRRHAGRAGGRRADRRGERRRGSRAGACSCSRAARRGRRARRRAVAPAASLGPVLDTEPLVRHAVAARAPARRRATAGRCAPTTIERGHFYTAFPEGADREQLGVAARRRPARRRRELDLPPERARLGAARDRRLLEDLHARGLRDRALPHAARSRRRRAEAGARLPVPLLDVRPGDGRRRCSSARPAGRCRSCRCTIDADGQPARRRQLLRRRSARRGGACATGGAKP